MQSFFLRLLLLTPLAALACHAHHFSLQPKHVCMKGVDLAPLQCIGLNSALKLALLKLDVILQLNDQTLLPLPVFLHADDLTLH